MPPRFSSFRLGLILASLLALLATAGCGVDPLAAIPTPRPADPTPTWVPAPASTAAPAAKASPAPSPARGVSPTAAPKPSPAAPAASPTSAGLTSVKIALIALDSGKLGCGDDVVLVDRAIPATRAPLGAALRELLALKSRTDPTTGLYTALYQSDLQLASVVIVDQKATIKLTGQLRLGGVCDNPRVQAQFERTALQFSTVKAVEVFVNDRPLAELLSGR